MLGLLVQSFDLGKPHVNGKMACGLVQDSPKGWFGVIRLGEMDG